MLILFNKINRPDMTVSGLFYIKGDKSTKTHKGFGWKLVDDIVH